MKSSLRYAVAGVALFGLAGIAHGADLDVLRGSQIFAPSNPVYADWSGSYVGAQVGYGNTNMDFNAATAGLVEQLLRNTTLGAAGLSGWNVLGSADTRDLSYGGFIGYNSQWEQVVLGVEANYNRTSITGASTDSMERLVSPGDGRIYDVTVASTASMHITDYGTLRGRAGYAMGRFMPYAFVGFAMGRIETDRRADVFGTFAPVGNPAALTPFSLSLSQPKTVYAVGYAAGGGVDVSILPCMFLRAEFEWLQLTGVSDMKSNIATGRVAAAYKF
jgi:outer membrane immunogenic protein